MRPLRPIEPSLLQDLIVQGDRVLEQPTEILLSLAQDSLTPRALLEVLVNCADASVADVARLHVNWAGELADWQTEIDAVFQTAQLGQNDRLAVELLKLGPVPPEFLSEWVPANVLIQALKNPHMPLRYRLKLLERLAQEPTLDPRLQVAESPETPLAVLEQLVGDLELPVRLATKYNPACPSALVQLVEGHHAIACDWSTDAEQLANLGRSRWDWIRLAVAQNPSASAETLMALANDRVFKIQLTVAKNPGTPASVLAVLAAHSNAVIQAAVAVHPNATETILNQVFPTQQALLMQRKNLPVSILRRFFDERSTITPLWKNQSLRYFLMQQPNTPTSVLAEFARVELEAVRADITASHSESHPEIIEKWVIDRIGFLAEIAQHPNISVEILQNLSQYSNNQIQLAVAQNPLTPESLRIQILTRLLKNPESRINIEVAKNPQAPLLILEQLADASNPVNKTIAAIRSIVPSISSPLCDRIHNFINHRQSSNQILFWLRQDAAFRDPILQEWHELIVSLDDIDRQVIEALGRSTIRMGSGISRQDGVWLAASPFETENRLSENYILCGLLTWSNMINDNDIANQELIKALLENPSIPDNLRNHLWQQYRQEPDDFGRYQDIPLRLALACNLSVPELERLEFLQQIVDSNVRNIPDAIIRSVHTPVSILERIAQQGEGGIQQVVKSPNAPVNILRQAVQQDNSYTLRLVAENPNTPLDLLKSLALHPDRGIRETVLKNPNLDPLGVYQIQLELQAQEELTQASQVLSGRPDSPYALAQVLEKGDRNAKISAARNPRTPITVLEHLAQDSDETVRSVLIDSQTIPLSLRLLMTQDSSVNIRCGLARKHTYRDTPTEVLEQLANDESEKVRALVAANSCTPIETLIRLGNDASMEVKQSLVSNPNTPTNILNRLGLEEDIFNIRNPNTPGIVLAHAVNAIKKRQSYDYTAKNALSDFLKHPVKGSQMPATTLAELANHSNSSVRYRVAQHPNTPTSALELLAKDDYVPTIRAVVDNPNTPPHILEQLALSPDVSTRLSVVRNPNTPSGVLAAIIQSSVTSGNAPNRTVDTLKSAFPGDQNDVLREIAGKPQTPLEALEILARREFITPPIDPNSILPPRSPDDILRSLAYNPSLTPALLGILTQDPCVEVRVALLRHPNLTIELWQRLTEDNAISVRSAIAASPQAPATVLASLASDAEVEVRQKLAANPNAPETLLHQLTQDSDLTVRSAIATNVSTPIPLLEQLAQDEKVEVLRAVAQNPNTPASIREVLRDLVPPSRTSSVSPTLRSLNRLYNPNTDDLATILAEYAQSENAFVRLVTLLHPLTPVEVLEQGGRSQSWLERYAAAENSATPAPMRQQLAQDSNRIVRAAACTGLA